MKAVKNILSLVIIFILCFGIYTYIDHKKTSSSSTEKQRDKVETVQDSNNVYTEEQEEQTDEPEKTTDTTNNTSNENEGDSQLEQEHAVDPAFATSVENIAMLVNPQLSIPEDFVPDDLVYPDVRFLFDEKIEKRMLREEAARALEAMFEAAEKDGIYLAGVSGYRSHQTQTQLFNYYVERDGYDKAKTYSAIPGTSEHETGLAIDVSGSTGKCAAQDCFADTVEAVWIAENSAEYGFIIRYPKGKEDITGYKYEPWHLRYVGKDVAKHIFNENITLEEYYGK